MERVTAPEGISGRDGDRNGRRDQKTGSGNVRRHCHSQSDTFFHLCHMVSERLGACGCPGGTVGSGGPSVQHGPFHGALRGGRRRGLRQTEDDDPRSFAQPFYLCRHSALMEISEDQSFVPGAGDHGVEDGGVSVPRRTQIYEP